MRLCSNRAQGEVLGPHSSLHPSLPTTCFDDVILVPLATWVFMLLIAALLIPQSIRAARQKRTYSDPQAPSAHNVGVFRGPGSFFSSAVSRSINNASKTDENIYSPPKSLRIPGLCLAILYYFLIVAMIAMISLEIARQISADLGIGLLPFNYVGVLLAFFVHAFIHTKTSRLVNCAFWLLFIIFMALKVGAYAKESDEGYARKTVLNGVPLDMYKVSDQVTDDSTMIGVSFVLLLLEIVGVFGLKK